MPLSPTTTGGRPIPPRSEFRHSPTMQQGHSPSLIPEGPASPVMPERSERRRSRDGIVAPLNVSPVHPNQSPSQPPSQGAGNGYGNGNGVAGNPVQQSQNQGQIPNQATGAFYGSPPARDRDGNEPLAPMSPTTTTTAVDPSGRPKTPNFSRPGIAGVGTSPSTASGVTDSAVPAQGTTPLGNTTTISGGPGVAPQKPVGKRQGFTATLKGLHGAGEALRGSVNEKIAHATHDQAEEERMRAVREKGMGEWRGSGLEVRSQGLREGFREKAEGRMRMRRASRDGGVHGSEGPGGLEAVRER